MLKKPQFVSRPDMRRLPIVIEQTGFSGASIYRLVKLGQFPPPVKIGARASAWVGSEVDEFIASRIATRNCK